MFRILSNVGSRLLQGTGSLPGLTSNKSLSLAMNGSLVSKLVPKPILSEQVRTVTKFSHQRGRRKTVHAVVDRFFRLHWGGWIRTKAGRHRKLWSKTPVNRRQLREHVLCNATQCTLLDKMVSQFWRKPKYYIQDPYESYHTREEFAITRRKPWRPEGWEP